MSGGASVSPAEVVPGADAVAEDSHWTGVACGGFFEVRAVLRSRTFLHPPTAYSVTRPSDDVLRELDVLLFIDVLVEQPIVQNIHDVQVMGALSEWAAHHHRPHTWECTGHSCRTLGSGPPSQPTPRTRIRL